MIATIISDTIRFVMTNFSLTFFVLGLVAAAVSLLRAPRPLTTAVVVDHVFSYFLLFTGCFNYLYNAFFHIFLGDYAARYIGWAQSPFQAEVGFASLGFAVLGLLAFRGSFDYRVAAVVAPACFLFGAVGGHVYQIITTGNEAAGNSGLILYMAVLIPLVGFALLGLQYRYAHPRSTATAARAVR